MRSDEQRLRDVLEAIECIEKYAKHGRPLFDADELVQTWIVHHLEVLGEATRALSQELRRAHPEIPWRSISAMRNLLIHSYFRVDLDEVWSVIENDIDELKAQIQMILTSLSGDLADDTYVEHK